MTSLPVSVSSLRPPFSGSGSLSPGFPLAPTHGLKGHVPGRVPDVALLSSFTCSNDLFYKDKGEKRTDILQLQNKQTVVRHEISKPEELSRTIQPAAAFTKLKPRKFLLISLSHSEICLVP